MGKFKKILLGIGIFIVLVAITGLYKGLLLDRHRGKIQFVKIGDATFSVDVADNPVSQAKGLSGREFMEESHGMIFLFGNYGVRGFWMQGMKFSLDIIWISGDKIVGIAENLPPAGFGELEIYNSPENVDKVLEINAGLSKKYGFKIGDRIVLE